ncbi:MAG: L-threonylcarbamoyladenylate synthase [Ilumatobacteraceae bacterium]
MSATGSDLVTTDIDRAVARLDAGGVVAIPTETVYGLAALADRPDAIRRMYAIKGRPTDHPSIVHVADVDHVHEWAVLPDGRATILATACWPGPLTLLLARGPRVADEVTGGRPTVGIRVPAHPMTNALLRRLDGAVAAPSANRFGQVSPTTAAHVVADLGDLLDPERDAILDGGPCPVGIESTIIDCTVAPPQVLRPGGIPTEDVERLLDGALAPAAGPVRAAGMLASHYAPRCRVHLATDRAAADATQQRIGAAGRAVGVLDRTDDLVAATRHLYADLRDADRRGLDDLVVVLPPPAGLGHALRDRLTKAAADRPG